MSSGPPAYTWRPIQPGDLPALHHFLAAVRAHDAVPGAEVDSGAASLPLEHLLHLLGDQVETNTRLALAPDGTLAAAGFLYLPPGDDRVALFDGAVAAAHRGRGLGRALVEAWEARARQAFGRVVPGAEPLLRTSCAAHQSGRIALFEQCGLRPVRYSYRMRRDLALPVAEAPLGPGLGWAPFTPALDAPLMDAFNLAFAGSYGVPRMDPETWHAAFTGVPQFRPDLTYAVFDQETLVGFCLNWVGGEGSPEGWVEAVGVLPAWRGRGIATALLARALRLFQGEGLLHAGLDVDAENPTGAVRLYQRHGFEIARETIHYGKQLG